MNAHKTWTCCSLTQRSAWMKWEQDKQIRHRTCQNLCLLSPETNSTTCGGAYDSTLFLSDMSVYFYVPGSWFIAPPSWWHHTCQKPICPSQTCFVLISFVSIYLTESLQSLLGHKTGKPGNLKHKRWFEESFRRQSDFNDEPSSQ